MPPQGDVVFPSESRMTRISRIFGKPSHQVYRSIEVRIPSTREMPKTLQKTRRKIEKYLKIQSETDGNCPNFSALKNVGIFRFSRRFHGDFYRHRRAVGSQNTICISVSQTRCLYLIIADFRINWTFSNSSQCLLAAFRLPQTQ